MSSCARDRGGETASLTRGEERGEKMFIEFTNYKNKNLTTVRTRADDGARAC